MKIDDEELRFINAVEDMTDEERDAHIAEHYDEYLLFLPKGSYKIELLKKVWGRHIASKKIETEVEIVFYNNEVAFLQSLPTEEIKRLFYSLMCKAKLRPHGSGWIRLDFEETIRYGFPESKAKKLRLENLSQCREYGFDAQVVGSNQPVLCFKLSIGGDAESGVAGVVTNFTACDKYNDIVGEKTL